MLASVVQRTGDLACRYGGEEFVILLPETGTDGAATVARAALQAVSALALPHAASAVAGHVTLSIGVATHLMAEHDATLSDSTFSSFEHSLSEQLVADADAALYDAKRHGRNQAWLHDAHGCRWLAGSRAPDA